MTSLEDNESASVKDSSAFCPLVKTLKKLCWVGEIDISEQVEHYKRSIRKVGISWLARLVTTYVRKEWNDVNEIRNIVMKKNDETSCISLKNDIGGKWNVSGWTHLTQFLLTSQHFEEWWKGSGVRTAQHFWIFEKIVLKWNSIGTDGNRHGEGREGSKTWEEKWCFLQKMTPATGFLRIGISWNWWKN